jgi:hypothetical protein
MFGIFFLKAWRRDKYAVPGITVPGNPVMEMAKGGGRNARKGNGARQDADKKDL